MVAGWLFGSSFELRYMYNRTHVHRTFHRLMPMRASFHSKSARSYTLTRGIIVVFFSMREHNDNKKCAKKPELNKYLYWVWSGWNTQKWVVKQNHYHDHCCHCLPIFFLLSPWLIQLIKHFVPSHCLSCCLKQWIYIWVSGDCNPKQTYTFHLKTFNYNSMEEGKKTKINSERVCDEEKKCIGCSYLIWSNQPTDTT